MATITNEEGWVTISTDSGEGNTAITATVNEVNTSRVSRTAVLVGTTDHGAEAVANIVQGSKGEFVSFDPVIYSMANNATTITLTGKSNSKRLTFSLPTAVGVGQSLFLTLPSTFTATKGNASQTVNNGQDLPNDYGLVAQYDFSLTLTINDAGSPATSRTEMVYVDSYGGARSSASVTQAGVASTILFDGLTNQTYDMTSKLVGQTQTINIGVTPTGEPWNLEFDE